MTMFVARYDLRCPPIAGASRGDLYAAALDQAAWADERGFDTLVLSEHHGIDDGYLPSPVVLAAAFAGRTRRIPITISALVATLYDPLRLAEDMAVLDHASGGRVAYVLGLGYRPDEYAMFDLDWHKRGKRIEHIIETLLAAWTGEPFEYEGRTVQITPTPLSSPHPMIFYGGGSPAAARRAAKYGLSFFPQHTDPALPEAYAAACAEFGTTPGMVLAPSPGPGTIFCSEDPDRFWKEAGEHLLYEAREYHAWQEGVTSAVHDDSETVEQMRANGVYSVMTPDELIEHARKPEITAITMHPLCGGLPIELSWESLRLIGDVVLPAVRG